MAQNIGVCTFFAVICTDLYCWKYKVQRGQKHFVSKILGVVLDSTYVIDLTFCVVLYERWTEGTFPHHLFELLNKLPTNMGTTTREFMHVGLQLSFFSLWYILFLLNLIFWTYRWVVKSILFRKSIQWIVFTFLCIYIGSRFSIMLVYSPYFWTTWDVGPR